jgi:uncharacterized protein (DUF2336 family)
MTPSSLGLLTELDLALQGKPESWRSTALRQIVDLFLSGADAYDGDQIDVFDEVIVRLIQKMDRVQLAELSKRLVPAPKGPAKVFGRLARHPDAAVSGPVIDQGNGLPDSDIVELADKDRVDINLLMRIAKRPGLSPAVTDVLLKRGNKAIQRILIDNPNARISEGGFARVIMALNGDKDLAGAISAREDVPPELRVWLTKTLSE